MHNYSGSAYTGASLGDTTAWVSAVGGTAPTIKYVGRDSTTYTESDTAPTAVGTYTATVTLSGAQAGNYSLTITGNGNFEGTVTKAFVILPASGSKSGNSEDIGTGSINMSASGASVNTDIAALIAAIPEDVLNADYLSEIAAEGLDVDIALKAEATDPSAADKNAVSKKLGKYTVGQYWDISLVHYENGDNMGKITRLNDNISITIKVPNSLLQTNVDVKRTYAVIRVHDGSAEMLDATFNASNETLTFKTDRFSTYAVVYKDSTTPKTGDTRTTIMWGGMMLVGLMTITAGAMLPNKKRYHGKYCK